MVDANPIEELSHEMELISAPRATNTLMRNYFTKTPLVELELKLYSWLCASFPDLSDDVWGIIVGDYIGYSNSISLPDMGIKSRLLYAVPLRRYNSRMNRTVLVHTTGVPRVLKFVGIPWPHAPLQNQQSQDLQFEILIPVTIGIYPMMNRQGRTLLPLTHPAHSLVMRGKSWTPNENISYHIRTALYHLAYTLWGYKFFHSFEHKSVDLVLNLRFDYNPLEQDWSWNFKGLFMFPRLSSIVMEKVMNVVRLPPLYQDITSFKQTERADRPSSILDYMDHDVTDSELDDEDDEDDVDGLSLIHGSGSDPEMFLDEETILPPSDHEME